MVKKFNITQVLVSLFVFCARHLKTQNNHAYVWVYTLPIRARQQ